MFRKLLSKTIHDTNKVLSLKLYQKYDINQLIKAKIPINNLVELKKHNIKSKLVKLLYTKSIDNIKKTPLDNVNSFTSNAELKLKRLGIDIIDFRKNHFNIQDYQSVIVSYSKLKRPHSAPPQTIMDLVSQSHNMGKITLY